MTKIAERYLETDPWLIVEEGFHPNRGRVSEAVFSLANEFTGVRGYFDEGYSGDRLMGSYVNGIFEEKPIEHPAFFKGFATRFCFMVNTVDWLYTRIRIDGELLDPARSKIISFKRTLDMKKGMLTREMVWETGSGKQIKLEFQRFLSMVNPNLGFQRIIFKPLNFSGRIDIQSGLDFSQVHELENKNFWKSIKKNYDNDGATILCTTETSRQHLFCSFSLALSQTADKNPLEGEKFIGYDFSLELLVGNGSWLEKKVVIYAQRKKDAEYSTVWDEGLLLVEKYKEIKYQNELKNHIRFWKNAWEKLDIIIEGDPESQQGMRFGIFNLHQTYHGNDPTLNVGAKGLTGEFYYGWTWWDTETYCLPFYIFSNPQAARSLLEYRYNTLPQALERAKEMDCEGSCYPMGTIDGTESCFTWQHGNLEIHVTAAIPYGIWHYMKVCNDWEFLYSKGIEMLIQTSRYFASRGAWCPTTGEYGFYGVMGPDEFQMMVNNNCYTNLLAKKTFEYAIEVVDKMKNDAPAELQRVVHKTGLKDAELQDWQMKAQKMNILFNKETGLFEQQEGYFNLPYVDVKAIPHTEFPLYKNWEYGRIFRNSMTKQPDVLLFLFFFSRQYSMDIKRVNYEYYEPRCSHESSLSPAIHSILASELGKHEEAYDFSSYASRLDLDDYNRNTHEGLHITSMAATWMNIVYGFGGMRSDGALLSFNPSLPAKWKSYSFKIIYRDSILCVTVKSNSVRFRTITGQPVTILLYDKEHMVDKEGFEVRLKDKSI